MSQIERRQCRRTMALRGELEKRPVGADSIRPQLDGIERLVGWNQLLQLPLGFPRGEAVTTNNRHFGTDYLS